MKSVLSRLVTRSFGGLRRAPRFTFSGGAKDHSGTEDHSAKNQEAKSHKAEADLSDQEESERELLSKMEMEGDRLGFNALKSFVKALKGGDQSTAKVLREIDFLFEQQRVSHRLQNDIQNLEKINNANRDKFGQLQDLLEEKKAEAGEVSERLTKEIEKEKKFAISKFAKDCLNIIDNIDRCVGSFVEEATLHQEEAISEREANLQTGIKLILADSINILKRFGVEKIDVNLGDQANPALHYIVFHIPVPGRPNDEIIEISQKGYMIGDRVLRPAKVGVVKNN